MAKLSNKQDKVTMFYPLPGTAFCDKGSPAKILVVESSENLAAINDLDDGFVAVHSLECGFEDFEGWLEKVKKGSIEVVWCPDMKRVSNNKDYLTHWKL